MTSIRPMLVSEIPGHRNRIAAAGHVFVQPKLDGWCCMANTRTRRIYTRSGREIITLPHINAALPSGGPEWLHGELWRKGWDCNDTQMAVKHGALRVELHVFDCVSDEGFGGRSRKVMSNVSSNIIVKVPTISGVPHTQIRSLYDTFLSAGYEGIIIRLDGHGYYHGRSINVFKMKPGTEGV